MRAYIQHNKDGQCININSYNAYTGFFEMGYEVIPYTNILEIEGRERKDVVHGNIGQVQKAWNMMGIPEPEMLDYPEQLKLFMGREYQISTLDEACHEKSGRSLRNPSKIIKYSQVLYSGYSGICSQPAVFQGKPKFIF